MSFCAMRGKKRCLPEPESSLIHPPNWVNRQHRPAAALTKSRLEGHRYPTRSPGGSDAPWQHLDSLTSSRQSDTEAVVGVTSQLHSRSRPEGRTWSLSVKSRVFADNLEHKERAVFERATQAGEE